ncbi:MAG: site-specific integrase, partial [Chitinophagales bacterium]|nr:site-specific integrase [Chitinophagales bacterium]
MERSLSSNSIQAYVHDVELLNQFLSLQKSPLSPEEVTLSHLQDFIAYINELGLNDHSQARILSGIRAFYKYLMMEDLV